MIQFSTMNVGQFFGFVWVSFIANFGKEPYETTIDDRRSYKTIVIISLLGGSVIWIGFYASLTSELALLQKCHLMILNHCQKPIGGMF